VTPASRMAKYSGESVQVAIRLGPMVQASASRSTLDAGPPRTWPAVSDSRDFGTYEVFAGKVPNKLARTDKVLPAKPQGSYAPLFRPIGLALEPLFR
jgi:hypothetical protein